MTKMLTHIEAMVNGEAPPAPIARLIGFEVISVKPGEAVVELQTSEKHANPMGTVHGGVLCDIADAAMGIAYAANLDDGESFTTLELKINFLKPVWETKIRAEAWVIRRGKTVGMCACDLRDGNGEIIAHATSTLMTLRGEQAKGR